MNSKTTPPATRNKRLSIYLISNFCFVLFMLAAIPFIRSGQARFLPHATINKEYVSETLTHGTAEDIDTALKTTEVYRAAGYQDLVGMMDLMQVTALVLALLFVVNGFVLFRLRQSAEVPAHPAEVPAHP
jgi:TctA family transporter